MSFVFISHANADKPRIKCITDYLMKEASLPLFIDRPSKMKYSFSEIEEHNIQHLEGGSPWRRDLDAAVKFSICVLLFITRNILEDPSDTFKREIFAAEYLEKIIVVRLEDIKLPTVSSKLNLPIRLEELQKIDLFVPDSSSLHELDEHTDNLKHVVKAIEAKIEQYSDGKYGPFPSAEQLRPPTAEQATKFLMMMNREEVSLELANRNMTLSLVVADAHARAGHMRRRLSEVELPCLIPSSASRDASADFCDFKKLKAELICGESSWEGQKWQPGVVTWPDISQRSTEDVASSFIEAIIRSVGFRLPSRKPYYSNEQRLQDFATTLSGSMVNCFLACSFKDKPSLRRKNAALITRLDELLKDIPTNRFRLMVHVEPPAKHPRFRRKTYNWLTAVTASTRTEKYFSLGRIDCFDLDEWCELMAEIIEETAENISNTVRSIFDDHPTDDMTFYELEQRIKPIINDWHLKPRSVASAPGAQQIRWRDAEFQAF